MPSKLRYTVYDAERREYLRRAERPDDRDDALVTDWTRHPARALRFPGVKSAARMVAKLGRYGQFVILNQRGEVVG